MKRRSLLEVLWMVLLAVGMAQGAGAEVASTNGTLPTELTAIPVVSPDTPGNKAVCQGIEKVRQNLTDGGAWASLGDALTRKLREAADSRFSAHAETAYRKALALNAQSTAAMVGMARLCEARHQFKQSAEWADKAIALDIKNPAAFGVLAEASRETGDLQSALGYLQKLIETRPDLATCTQEVCLLFQTGDRARTSSMIAKALELSEPWDETTSGYRATLAEIQWNSGNYLAAEKLLNEILRRTPDCCDSLIVLGKVKCSRKDLPAAAECYKKALAISPDRIEVVAALGDLARIQGRKDEAEKHYARAESLCLAREKQIGEELEIVRFYADHDRNLPTALRIAEAEYKERQTPDTADALAWCRYKSGHYKAAREAIEKALSWNTPDPIIHFHAGMIYAQQGEVNRPTKHLTQALSLSPAFHPIYAPLAISTLKQLGHRPKDPEPSIEQ